MKFFNKKRGTNIKQHKPHESKHKFFEMLFFINKIKFLISKEKVS